MFGYVAANPRMMTEAETNRYRGLYCGLCRCLGQRHGQISRVSLTYDMTFLILFLNAMYEPEEREESFRCIVHPKGRHTSLQSPITEYAADMNILLAYLNCMDNWQDDRNGAALLGAGVFRSGFLQAKAQYPRQWQTISRELAELSRLERECCPNPDLPAACFGRLLGELFVYDEQDHFAPELRQFGFMLGKLVYLYDACMDLDQDRKRGSYNPFLAAGQQTLTLTQMRGLLSVYLSACVEIYRRLPVVQDRVIIENILYSGIWQELNKKYGTSEQGSEAE